MDRLAADPATWLHAELNEWEHPVSHEWLALYQLHALDVQLHTKKPHRFLPAPFDPKPKKHGTPLSREAFDRLMEAQRARPAERQTPIA